MRAELAPNRTAASRCTLVALSGSVPMINSSRFVTPSPSESNAASAALLVFRP